MSAITVTAVNTGTEALTATAHGLTTGDRFRLRNVGGALPAATPTLTAATDYFAIVVDANTIKISDTNAHASAGTNIVNLTGSGSGTTTIEYGLPYCIPTALAAAGTQIKSVNDNGVWNALVALYCLLTGQAQSIWSTVVFAVSVTFNALATFAAGATASANQHFTVSGTGDYKHGDRGFTIPAAAAVPAAGSPTFDGVKWTCGAASNVLSYPVDVQAGKQIKTLIVWYLRSTVGTVTFNLRRAPLSTGTPTTVAGTTVATGNTLTSTTITANHVVLATDQYTVECTSAAIGDQFHGIAVVLDNT